MKTTLVDLLPTEVQDHVVRLATNPWFDRLVPRRAGSTDNLFFAPNEETHRIPTIERRCVETPMPKELAAVYECYPDDTEFTAPHGWTFLSEAEIQRRRTVMIRDGQSRLVDIAYVYVGMGHVTVLSYDPVSKCVLTNLDGGANGFDREHNARMRLALNVETVHKCSFDEWWRTKAPRETDAL